MNPIEKPKFDSVLILTILVLSLIGLACIYSATRNAESALMRGLFFSQIQWFLIGIVLMVVVASIPVRFFYGFSYLLYGASVLLLAYLEFAGGHVSKGAERWIMIGPIKLQPSEFVKIGVALALARYFSTKSISLEAPSSLVVPGLIILIPFGLVLKQPDLGTALIVSAMALPILLWAGMPMIEIFLVVSPILSMVLSFHVIPWGLYFLGLLVLLYFLRPSLLIAGATIGVNLVIGAGTAIIWGSLHDYQKNRLLSFIDPDRDPFGAGYQIIQSKVAVGSGRIFGKGYLEGSQTKLSFLPEQHTDFIFSVFGEQFGFIGAIILLFMFFVLIYRCFVAAREAKNRFSNLLCVGIGSIYALHIYTNMGMTIGMMPVTGIPLPFLSYGGSFMFTCMILAGLIVGARRGTSDF